MDVEVTLVEEADLEKNLTAIRRGFGTHPFAAEILPTLTRDFYIWKHWTPAGRALIASVRQNADVVAIVAASPVRIVCPTGIVRAWQIGDIATVPEFRSRGLFRQSLESLRRAIPDGELMFCFPNPSALPEFLRQGFCPVGELACHARPVMPWVVPHTRGSEPRTIEHFDVGISPAHDGLAVLRDANYLEWRYHRCPTRRYGAAYCGSPLDPDGMIVVRRYRALGLGIALIMDMDSKNVQTTGALLAWAARWARQQQLHVLMTMADPPPLASMWRQWLVRIPSVMLPKRQVCVARVGDADTRRHRAQFGRWHLQAGDWDGL